MPFSFELISRSVLNMIRLMGRLAAPLLLGASVLCLAFYLVGLDYAPAPYFSDESLVSAEVIKISRGWSDFGLLIRHSSLPDFSYLPYVSVSFLLTKLFGFSVYGFRLVSAVLSIGTGCALIYLSRLFGLGWRYALFVPPFYWLMPPVIVQSRVAWDPAIFPLVSVLAVCSLEYPVRRIKRGGDLLLGSLALFALNASFWVGLVAWAYPPGRLCSVLVCTFYLYRYWVVFKGTRVKGLFPVFAVPFLSGFGLMGSALFASLKSTEGSMSRSSSELILGQDSLLQKIFIRFFSNVTNLDHLLLDGDPNLRHSLPGMGALGVAGFVLLTCVVFIVLSAIFASVPWLGAIDLPGSRADLHSMPILFVLVVIFASPSFLGNTVVHSLRACATYPFLAILASVLMSAAVKRLSASRQELALGLVVLIIILSLIHLSRYTLGGLSFVGKKQLQGPAPLHSTYPGLSRSAFSHSSYVASQGLSDAEVCERVGSSIKRVGSVAYGEAVEDSRSILVAAQRSLSCAEGGN